MKRIKSIALAASTAATLMLGSGIASANNVVTVNTVQIFGTVDPAKINEDPEGVAWFFKLKMKDMSEMDSLMTKDEYDKFAKESAS